MADFFYSYSLITVADNGLVVTRQKAITWTNWWWMSTIASLGHNEWSVKGTWYAYIWHIKPHLCVIVLSFKSWYASHYLSYKWHHKAFKGQAEYVLHPCVSWTSEDSCHYLGWYDLHTMNWLRGGINWTWIFLVICLHARYRDEIHLATFQLGAPGHWKLTVVMKQFCPQWWHWALP